MIDLGGFETESCGGDPTTIVGGAGKKAGAAWVCGSTFMPHTGSVALRTDRESWRIRSIIHQAIRQTRS
jgi:hypothetical protein